MIKLSEILFINKHSLFHIFENTQKNAAGKSVIFLKIFSDMEKGKEKVKLTSDVHNQPFY